jgi:hypothetical protein
MASAFLAASIAIMKISNFCSQFLHSSDKFDALMFNGLGGGKLETVDCAMS